MQLVFLYQNNVIGYEGESVHVHSPSDMAIIISRYQFTEFPIEGLFQNIVCKIYFQGVNLIMYIDPME